MKHTNSPVVAALTLSYLKGNSDDAQQNKQIPEQQNLPVDGELTTQQVQPKRNNIIVPVPVKPVSAPPFLTFPTISHSKPTGNACPETECHRSLSLESHPLSGDVPPKPKTATCYIPKCHNAVANEISRLCEGHHNAARQLRGGADAYFPVSKLPNRLIPPGLLLQPILPAQGQAYFHPPTSFQPLPYKPNAPPMSLLMPPPPRSPFFLSNAMLASQQPNSPVPLTIPSNPPVNKKRKSFANPQANPQLSTNREDSDEEQLETRQKGEKVVKKAKAVAGASAVEDEGGKAKAKPQAKPCNFDNCPKKARGSTAFCIQHGGGKRCQFLNCSRSARGATAFCVTHGGGKRCTIEGCTKSAVGSTSLCIAHGGGKRCQYQNCPHSAEGATNFCIKHGGGRRCKTLNCGKSAVGTTDYCVMCGGGKRCLIEGCGKSAVGSSHHCKLHGGGRRCTHPDGCTKSAQGSTFLCILHGGGRRCKEDGCNRSVQGSALCCKKHLAGRSGDDTDSD